MRPLQLWRGRGCRACREPQTSGNFLNNFYNISAIITVLYYHDGRNRNLAEDGATKSLKHGTDNANAISAAVGRVPGTVV